MISAEKARELLNGATNPPWRQRSWSDLGEDPRWVISDHTSCYVVTEANAVTKADARLIAAAPDLAETVIAQAEQLTDLREQIALARGHVNDLQAFGLLSPSNVDTLLAILVEDQP